MEWVRWFCSWSEIVMIYYFFFLNGGYIFLSLVAFWEVHGHLRRSVYGGYDQVTRSPLTPAISVIVPAHDEELSIATTVNNLLHLDYMRYEVIVINDGSDDSTMNELIHAFELSPTEDRGEGLLETKPIRAVYKSKKHHRLTVIDKENGGKADALNAGIDMAEHSYFCAIDADVILEPDALQRIVLPILESPERVIAIGGIIRVGNGCTVEKGRITQIEISDKFLVVFQIIEYFRAFLCGRTGFSRFNALMIISGAFGVFDRDLAVAVGGYRVNTVGEDMDLVTRLHAHMGDEGIRDYSVKFIPDPVCWTEVPTSLRVLSRQRRRWQKGMLEVLQTNKKMFFNPRYGGVGMFAFPFLWLFEGWGVIIECIGYVIFGLLWFSGGIEEDYIMAFFCCAILCGTTLSLSGILLGEMTPRQYPRFKHWAMLVLFAFLENFGYRQILSLIRLRGVLDYVLGVGNWGRMERKGHGEG